MTYEKIPAQLELPFLTPDSVKAQLEQCQYLVDLYSTERLDELWEQYDRDLAAAKESGNETKIAAFEGERKKVLDNAPLHREAAKRYLDFMERHPDSAICNDDTLLGRGVRDFISEQSVTGEQNFIPFDDPRIKKAMSKEGPRVIYERMPDQDPLALPTTSFVSADGFADSWEKGWGNLEKTDDRTGVTASSEEMIQRYSEMSADTAPPVDKVVGFYQPNGVIAYMSSDAHRVASAIMRGDPEIPVKSVTLVPISEDLISAAESRIDQVSGGDL